MLMLLVLDQNYDVRVQFQIPRSLPEDAQFTLLYIASLRPHGSYLEMIFTSICFSGLIFLTRGPATHFIFKFLVIS